MVVREKILYLAAREAELTDTTSTCKRPMLSIVLVCSRRKKVEKRKRKNDIDYLSE